MEVHKFFHYRIIPINIALQPHWTFLNSEASPGIWTCVTRPFRTHVHRVRTQDYKLNTELHSAIASTAQAMLAHSSRKTSLVDWN